MDPSAGTVRFNEWARDWLGGLHGIGPKTRAGYESLLRSRILPTFGDMELRRISTPGVRAWVASMADGGLSPARIRQALQLLRASLEVAVEVGLIPRNPAARVKAPPVRKRRQLFLTAFELGRLADESGDYAPLVWPLGWSGLRWGEAVALRVGGVNPKRRRVRVEESATEIGGQLVFGSTKTHQTRTVIVPRYVVTRLAPQLEGRGLR